MGQSLFREKDREVRSSRAIVLTPREARATNLLCQFPRQAAAGRRGTRLPLSLTSPKKNTKKSARGAQSKNRRQVEPELHQIAVNITKYNLLFLFFEDIPATKERKTRSQPF